MGQEYSLVAQCLPGKCKIVSSIPDAKTNKQTNTRREPTACMLLSDTSSFTAPALEAKDPIGSPLQPLLSERC